MNLQKQAPKKQRLELGKYATQIVDVLLEKQKTMASLYRKHTRTIQIILEIT
jgi:hypothetical protein